MEPTQGRFRWFFWPGEKMADLTGLSRRDDRQVFRLYINLLVWTILAIVIGFLVASLSG